MANEFKRIKNTDLQSLSFKEPLIVNDLLMEYKKKKEKFVAVKHLGFGVQRGECFGLLGKYYQSVKFLFKNLSLNWQG